MNPEIVVEYVDLFWDTWLEEKEMKVMVKQSWVVNWRLRNIYILL